MTEPDYSEQQVEVASMFGVSIGSITRPYDLVDSLERWRAQANGNRHRVCFVDNTTVAEAGLALGTGGTAPRFSPATVLSLEAIISAVVLYDEVRHLENPRPASDLLPASMAEALTEIQCDLFNDRQAQVYPGLIDFLDTLILDSWRTYQEFHGHHAFVTEVTRLLEAWGRTEVPPLLDPRWNEGWPSPIEDSARLAASDDSSTGSFHPTTATLTSAGVRGLFNIRIADGLRLPYLANRIRVPAIGFHLGQRSVADHGFVTPVHRELEARLAAHRKSVVDLPARGTTVSLPPLLAVAVYNCNGDLARLPQIIADLRVDARPFRSAIRGIEARWENGFTSMAGAELQDLFAELGAEYDKLTTALRRAIPATVAGAGAFLALTTAGISPAIAGLLVAFFTPGAASAVADRVYGRLLEPRRWFLSHLGHDLTASAVLPVDLVARIWGCSSDEAQRSVGLYQRVAQLS